MFNALFGRSKPATRTATRFTPRLEALDGRIAPGGVLAGGGAGRTASQVAFVNPDHVGEEIPQTGALAHAGHVDQFGGAYGGVL